MRRALPYTFLHRRLGSKAIYNASTLPAPPPLLRAPPPPPSPSPPTSATEERLERLEREHQALRSECERLRSAGAGSSAPLVASMVRGFAIGYTIPFVGLVVAGSGFWAYDEYGTWRRRRKERKAAEARRAARGLVEDPWM